MSRTVALMLALTVVAAGGLASGSSGARQTQRTITKANLDQYVGK